MSQSLDRALAILEQLAQKPAGLGELAEFLDVHKSTVLRLLQDLEAHGFARRTPDGHWDVGFGLVAVAEKSLDRVGLRNVVHPYLLRLGSELGHTIHLAQIVGNEVVYIDKVEGIGSVRMQSRVGAAVQLHTAGVAKAILAYTSPEIRSQLLAGVTYQRYTGTTITTPAALLAELDAVRNRGWAVDDGEYEDYINCVAVPIRDRSGAVTAGLSLTALRALAPLDSLRTHVPRLQDIADSISRELGWDGTTP